LFKNQAKLLAAARQKANALASADILMEKERERRFLGALVKLALN
jgi:hypothetical protein